MKKTSFITKEASTTTKNISAIVLLKVVQYPFLALSVMLIPRMMGPKIYGEYALLISIITIAASLITFGVSGEIFWRFVPEFEVKGDLSSIRKLSTNIIAFKSGVDLIVSLILFAVIYFTYRDRFPITYFFIIIAIVVAIDWGSVPYALLFGLNELIKFASRDLIRRVLGLILVLILFNYLGLLGAIISTLIVESFFTALIFYWTRKYFHIEDFKIDLTFLKPFLKFGFMFYLSWVLLTVWQRLGNPIVEYLTNSSREVALFDIPNQIFLITVAFTTFIINSLVPIFTKLLVNGKEGKLINWAGMIIKYIGIICTIIFWVYVIVGADLIPLIIGSDYAEIFPNGVVLLLGIFPMIFVQLGVIFSVVYKKPKRYVLALFFAFLCFIISSIILIPKYASMGCSIAVLISCVVLAVVMFVYFREKLFPCLVAGFKPITIGFIFIPFIFFRGNFTNNLILTICSILAYILLLFVSKILNLKEIQEIYQAIRHQPELQT